MEQESDLARRQERRPDLGRAAAGVTDKRHEWTTTTFDKTV